MIDLLQQSLPLAMGVALVFGLLVGSFLNVVIHRVPIMLEADWAAQAAEMRGEELPAQPAFNLMTPRSRCPHCGHQITALENIPVLSWLVLRGKCRGCGAPISARYPIVELITGLLSVLAIWQLGFTAAGLGAVLLGFFLVALTGIDLDTQLLPDNMTLPLLWIGLIFNLWGTYVSLQAAVIGAIAGYLILWSIYWLFKLATGKEGMGYGDFKLLAALGAWLGASMILPIVLAASIIGACVGIAMKLASSLREGRYVPFGPFLAAAGVAVMLIGKTRVLGWLGWA